MYKISSTHVLLTALVLVAAACGTSAQPMAEPVTDTPEPTATETLVPTKTPRPSATPRPTRTPNLAATERYQAFEAEAQSYFDLGYLTTVDGEFTEPDDFNFDWAQLGWYNWLPLPEVTSDFFMSAHFKWSSAYRNADTSGCGFIFAIQENGDHYAVFLDRSKILFLNADTATSYSRRVGLTRGTGRVKFDNPADSPQEADFTLIVNNAYAYVIVNSELIGEYTLSQSRNLEGLLGLTLLSGTNKDYGTRCEMTDIRFWIPAQ